MTTRGVPMRGAAGQGLWRRRRAEVENDSGDGPSHVDDNPLVYDGRHGRHPERLPVRGGCVFDGVASLTGGGGRKHRPWWHAGKEMPIASREGDASTSSVASLG